MRCPELHGTTYLSQRRSRTRSHETCHQRSWLLFLLSNDMFQPRPRLPSRVVRVRPPWLLEALQGVAKPDSNIYPAVRFFNEAQSTWHLQSQPSSRLRVQVRAAVCAESNGNRQLRLALPSRWLEVELAGRRSPKAWHFCSVVSIWVACHCQCWQLIATPDFLVSKVLV